MSVGEAERVEARIWDALEARIWDALEDPEIPVSVLGMGPIVSVEYRPEDRTADLQITFTAMGLPRGRIHPGRHPGGLAPRSGDRRGRDRGCLGSGVDQGPDPRRARESMRRLGIAVWAVQTNRLGGVRPQGL